jgi:hypothetical protein
MLSSALVQLHRLLIAEGVEKKVPYIKEAIILIIGSIVSAIEPKIALSGRS